MKRVPLSRVTAERTGSTDAVTAEGPADELSTLARLGAHEQELSRRLEEARRVAEARLAAAREEAARLKAHAEAECADELSQLRQERARELEAALTAIRDETAQQVEALARRAAANRERALARLVTAITSSGAP